MADKRDPAYFARLLRKSNHNFPNAEIRSQFPECGNPIAISRRPVQEVDCLHSFSQNPSLAAGVPFYLIWMFYLQDAIKANGTSAQVHYLYLSEVTTYYEGLINSCAQIRAAKRCQRYQHQDRIDEQAPFFGDLSVGINPERSPSIAVT
ncbi:MAG: hypothetical protein AB9879_01505 [Methanothrix sp.]